MALASQDAQYTAEYQSLPLLHMSQHRATALPQLLLLMVKQRLLGCLQVLWQ